jgi:hypothetical protein
VSTEPDVVASPDPAASADRAYEPVKTAPSILEAIFVWVAVGFVVATSLWIAIRLIAHD